MKAESPITGWRKSSFSTSTGACVEVAPTTSGMAVRDSKSPHTGTLSLPGSAWTTFLTDTADGGSAPR